MKRILITAERNQGNPFIDLWAESLEEYFEVTVSVNEFFHPSHAYDILNIHWPEAFTEWKNPTVQHYGLIVEKLKYWKGKAKIITTRHNYEPHELESPLVRELYQNVFATSDVIIHLGEHSKKDFAIRYPFAQQQQHLVIPHGNYKYPDTISKEEARNYFSINQHDFVALCFGRLRTLEEKIIVQNVYENIEQKNKVLLAPGWKGITEPSIYSSPINRLYSKWIDIRALCSRRYRIENRFVSEEMIQYYYKAADIAIIPRPNSLSSGALVLAFNFAKPVIGPEKGNIGEVIANTKNYYFHQKVDARQLFDIGVNNRRYALERWDWSLLSKDFYQRINL